METLLRLPPNEDVASFCLPKKQTKMVEVEEEQEGTNLVVWLIHISLL